VLRSMRALVALRAFVVYYLLCVWVVIIILHSEACSAQDDAATCVYITPSRQRPKNTIPYRPQAGRDSVVLCLLMTTVSASASLHTQRNRTRDDSQRGTLRHLRD